MTNPTQAEVPAGFTFSEAVWADAVKETNRLCYELDITNADHIVLWLEHQLDGVKGPLAYIACRILEAHEAAQASPTPSTSVQGAGEAFHETGVLCNVAKLGYHTMGSGGRCDWTHLREAVAEAVSGSRAHSTGFDPDFYPGHQPVQGINYNSLDRIVTAFVDAALSTPPAPASVAELPSFAGGVPASTVIGLARRDIARGEQIVEDDLKDDGTGALHRFGERLCNLATLEGTPS